MSYYDIDAILTDAQKVPCTFELDVPGLGYLDNNPSHPLKEGTRVELPLWLSVLLAAAPIGTNKAPVTLDLPNSLSTRVMNALKADPTTVDLRAQAQHYYGLGIRMLDLIEDDDVLDVLLATFKRRATEVGDHAANAGQSSRAAAGGSGTVLDGVEFLRGLDEMERTLFRATHDSSKATRTWLADIKKA